MECFTNPASSTHVPQSCYFCITKTRHVHIFCLKLLYFRMLNDLNKIGIKPVRCHFIFMEFFNIWLEIHTKSKRSTPVLFDVYDYWWTVFEKTFLENRKDPKVNQIMLVNDVYCYFIYYVNSHPI